MSLLNVVVLWIHLFSAVLFVGGSFFIWIVLMPALQTLSKDESERTRIMGSIARQFGRITNPILAILVLTGIYNGSWYLPSFEYLFSFKSYEATVLFVKAILVLILLILVYVHGAYYGRKIARLASERKIDQLKAVRRKSRLVSYANLVLMVAILVLAVMLQMPP
ncbi:MAG: CopD family protein [Thaumarchaeota archaeon]|nr:CopD family protein [Nitrososphaerota archaeon]